MASKKDLAAAQAFSRRRLLTAFVSGAPGGMELEPTKPLRAVISGIALAVLLVLGSLGLGKLNPGLKDGWNDNTLVATDGGSRYVALGGTLYPVLNITSARLLITGEFRVVRVTAAQIADTPRGPMVGIVGAPDALPAPEDLVADGWMSCVGPAGGMTTVLSAGDVVEAARVEIEGRPASADPPPGLLVSNAGELYLVTEGRRHLIGRSGRDAVLRALDQATVTPWPVQASWLNLFAPGSDLEPLALPGAGDPVPNPMAAPPGAVVGSVLRVTDGGEAGAADFFVIDPAGDLAPISDVALRLYRLGSGDGVGADYEVVSAQVQGMATARQAVSPDDWPATLPGALTDGQAGCAFLSTADLSSGDPTPVQLVGSASVAVPDEGGWLDVDPAGGALVVPVAGGPDAAGYVQLIDATGTAFPLPGADDDVLARLGYTAEDVVTVPQAWLALFGVGPELTIAAAQEPHGPGGAAADAAEPPSEECDPGTPRYVADRPAALSRLAADSAWQLATGAGVTVAVVDSGVDPGNAHLTGAVLPGVDLVGDGPDGRTDVAGHGTAIAGQVAARPHSTAAVDSGVVGLAPEAMILPVRVFVADTDETKAAGTAPRNDRTAAGIRYAAEQGAQVINVSISSTTDDAVLREAVRFATEQGSLVVASAGNRLTDPSEAARYPAAYPEVLAVTAVGEGDVATDAAIHGPHVDIAAPGTNVLTTFFAAGDCILAGDEASTSYATGYVSAAAALIAERYPDETPAQWAYRLTVTASRPQADARSDLLGWGVVRPWAALAFVDDGGAPGPPSPAHPPEPVIAQELEPVQLTESTDLMAPTRDASVWWGLGGAAAVLGATLLSFPGVRPRRRASRRRHRPVGAARPAQSS